MNASSAVLQVSLLEDDPILRDLVLIPGLQRYGFAVDGWGCASEFMSNLQRTRPNIVILDVGLPDSDGFTVARNVHQSWPELGVVMLTSRSDSVDRLRGLAEAADSYLTKPVEIDLLAVTLHSLARRLGCRQSIAARGEWSLSNDGWSLLSPGANLSALTRSERKLCLRLLETPGLLVSREALIASLTDNIHDFDAHRLDSMIHRLRSKVQRRCGEALPLSVVHGYGYILRPKG